MRTLSTFAIGLFSFAALTTLVAAPAQAGQHGRFTSVQGARGHGYVHSRNVSRQPGAIDVSRSTRTNSGRGVANQRSAQWGDGAYQGGASHTFANGASAGRSTSIVDNGDGSVSYSASRTRLDGSTRSVSGTAQRP
ncbi:hypothetical protein [Caulobacter sp. UNC358MFTsu5.1]|uniref:hypothetical protein n=1 Tax=Caulobacter sp. UNC358MFTsu5.1 TaxID=1449049 RepID=UPI0004A6F365|nr:hypothetical protein [Caulobacter sp. UNC358MFTsu5.1]